MEKAKKINLGCGVRTLKGYINVDQEKFGDVRADVRELPFPDDYADYILARQVLEHLPFRDVYGALKEWLRVLKPGGRMVITCPDFNQQVEMWLNTDFTPEAYEELTQGIYGNQLHPGEYHQTPITPQILRHYLKGLSDAKISVYQPGDKMIHYPGFEKEKRFYRYGEVHVDLIKTLCSSKKKSTKR